MNFHVWISSGADGDSDGRENVGSGLEIISSFVCSRSICR